jgi:type IX secretion system PorP/SprF family membrane protein
MKLKILVISLILLVIQVSKAQQDVQFSQNQFTKMLYNPAYSAVGNSICGTIIGRQQWAGFVGSPQTFLLSVSSPLNFLKISNAGVGLNVLQDQLGNERTLAANLNLGYAFTGIGTGKLAVGASFGIINKKFVSNWIATDNWQGDRAIPSDGNGQMRLDINAGIFYDASDFFAGVGITHIAGGNFTPSGSRNFIDQLGNSGNIRWALNYGLKQHIFITGGYNYTLPSNPSWELRPMVLVKTEGSSTQFDININAHYNKQIWGGISYRHQDAIVAMVGYDFQPLNLRVGYAYDVTISQIRRHSSGSHELVLNYCFKLPVKTIRIEKYRNVRFL